MGQKVNPISFRLAVNKNWSSFWYASSANYSRFVYCDYLIRNMIKKHYDNVIISKVTIKRTNCDFDSNKLFDVADRNCKISPNANSGTVSIVIYAQNVGAIIGKSAKNLDILKNKIKDIDLSSKVKIDVVEIKRPDIDASMVAGNIAYQLKKRASFKRVIKKMLENAMRYDSCRGIKVICSGRLGGAEIAKSEIFKAGSTPLHTLDANIDYGFAESFTTYGVIGIKVYIYLV